MGSKWIRVKGRLQKEDVRKWDPGLAGQVNVRGESVRMNDRGGGALCCPAESLFRSLVGGQNDALRGHIHINTAVASTVSITCQVSSERDVMMS